MRILSPSSKFFVVLYVFLGALLRGPYTHSQALNQISRKEWLSHMTPATCLKPEVKIRCVSPEGSVQFVTDCEAPPQCDVKKYRVELDIQRPSWTSQQPISAGDDMNKVPKEFLASSMYPDLKEMALEDVVIGKKEPSSFLDNKSFVETKSLDEECIGRVLPIKNFLSSLNYFSTSYCKQRKCTEVERKVITETRMYIDDFFEKGDVLRRDLNFAERDSLDRTYKFSINANDVDQNGITAELQENLKKVGVDSMFGLFRRIEELSKLTKELDELNKKKLKENQARSKKIPAECLFPDSIESGMHRTLKGAQQATWNTFLKLTKKHSQLWTSYAGHPNSDEEIKKNLSEDEYEFHDLTTPWNLPRKLSSASRNLEYSRGLEFDAINSSNLSDSQKKTKRFEILGRGRSLLSMQKYRDMSSFNAQPTEVYNPAVEEAKQKASLSLASQSLAPELEKSLHESGVKIANGSGKLVVCGSREDVVPPLEIKKEKMASGQLAVPKAKSQNTADDSKYEFILTGSMVTPVTVGKTAKRIPMAVAVISGEKVPSTLEWSGTTLDIEKKRQGSDEQGGFVVFDLSDKSADDAQTIAEYMVDQGDPGFKQADHCQIEYLQKPVAVYVKSKEGSVSRWKPKCDQ